MSGINSSGINTEAINGPGSLSAFSASGSGALAVARQSVQQSESGGALAVASQRVGWSGSGSLAIARQYVRLRLTGSGALAIAQQSVETQASGALAVASQRIRQAGVQTQVDRKGWDAFLYIGGVEIPREQVVGEIEITRTENNASLMNVRLRPERGVIDLTRYDGQSVRLVIQTKTGSNIRTDRLYTGIVDEPDLNDLNYGFMTLRCTDARREQINSQMANQVQFIGKWSPDIFDGADDVAEELEQRLTTTPKCVDFDAYGKVTISDYLPKATPDFTLTGADVYRRNNPSVTVAKRGRLINRLNLRFEMRYTRLRQRKRNFELIGPEFCDIMTTPGLSFILVDSLTNQLKNFAWPVNWNSFEVYGQPSSGVYNCGNGPFVYNTIVRVSGTYVQQTDADGDVITDSNGNPVTKLVNGGFVDLGLNFCERATWTAAYNFAQDVSEVINFTIDAPQSISQYGAIEAKQSNGRQVDFDSSSWEKNERFKDYGGTASDEFYADQTGSVQAYLDALETAVEIGKTKIIKSHRDNHVEFERSIWPEIDLKHTVKVDSTKLQCQGKVSQIRHYIGINGGEAYTRVRLSLSRSQGAAPTSSLSIPLLNAPLVGNQSPSTIKTYSYDAPGVAFNASGGTTSPVVIGLRTPAIDEESRNRQAYERDASLDIPIQNDLLVVNFNE